MQLKLIILTTFISSCGLFDTLKIKCYKHKTTASSDKQLINETKKLIKRKIKNKKVSIGKIEIKPSLIYDLKLSYLHKYYYHAQMIEEFVIEMIARFTSFGFYPKNVIVDYLNKSKLDKTIRADLIFPCDPIIENRMGGTSLLDISRFKCNDNKKTVISIYLKSTKVVPYNSPRDGKSDYLYHEEFSKRRR